MSTLFRNFASGTISDNPLTVGATTINSAGFSVLPVVAAPDVMWLVLDPLATAGTPEVVQVTAHSASATVVTVLRGQQTSLGGSAARQHALAIKWVAALTAQDLLDIIAALPSAILTTKGDLISRSSTAPGRLGVGANDQVLIADSGQTLGLKWGLIGSANLDDLNKPPSSASVATSQATTSTTYTDLATVGPAVTLTTGTLVRVSFFATANAADAADTSQASVAVSGATTIAAPAGSGVAQAEIAGSTPKNLGHSIVLAVTAGSNTFTMKYRGQDVGGGGVTSTFSARHIVVERLN